MKYTFSGLRSAELVGGWRIMFKVCEECHNKHLETANPLDCCRGEAQTADNILNILEINDHYT